MKIDENCLDCFHYYGYYTVNRCCNYIFDEGHSRPCPPGAACTVKSPRWLHRGKTASKSCQKSEEDPKKQEDI